MIDLERFFCPRSVAFVGATEDVRKFGGRCFRRMLDFGYSGTIYPVNPKYRTVFGRNCHPSISALPELPDHVGIVVPAQHVAGVLKECILRRVPFATVYTSGFRETGTARGTELQDEITDLARRGGIRIMGPNCNGFVSFVHGFCMTTTAALAGPRKPSGNIGIIAQSGGLGQINVMFRAHELGLGISHQVSCGNQADLDVLDFAEFMVSDPNTDVILMAVESIGDGRKLASVARSAAQNEKPIVILKLGRTEAGQRAAASHTGAVTGSDRVHSAAFRQYGLIRVNDCNELNQLAMLLRMRRWPRSRRAAAVAASGGHAVLFADLGADLGIEWPRYSQRTDERLNELLPSFGAPTNPTDLTTASTGNASTFAQALKAIADDDAVDLVVPIFTVNTEAEILAGANLIQTTRKPAAMLWTGKCSDNAELTAPVLVKTGVPVYRDALQCLSAVSASMRYGEFLRATNNPARRKPQRPAGADMERARELLVRQSERVLGERASRQILAAYGFDSLNGHLAHCADEAVEFASSVKYPVVLKIESPDIPHKTESGGVKLGLGDADAVTAAYRDILESVKRFNAAARIEGVLVQQMAPAGLELILGVSRDPTFGPVVSVGLGGIHVEVLRDIAHGIAPVDSAQATAMLQELRAFPLLKGVRGAGPRDIEAIVDTIVRLSWFAHDLRDDITELDINPLRALETGKGVRLLDALIVRSLRESP